MNKVDFFIVNRRAEMCLFQCSVFFFLCHPAHIEVGCEVQFCYVAKAMHSNCSITIICTEMF